MTRLLRWLFGLLAVAAALFVHLLPAPEQGPGRRAAADRDRLQAGPRGDADDERSREAGGPGAVDRAVKGVGASAAAPPRAPSPVHLSVPVIPVQAPHPPLAPSRRASAGDR